MLTSHKAIICCVCLCSLDDTAPYAILDSDFAHLDCADAYDAQDLGAVETTEFFGDWKESYADAVGIPLVGEL
jgi:hypothetical protein